MAKDYSEDNVSELVLYVENDADLYRQRAVPIMKNLAKKMLKGTYDKSLAPKIWKYLADDGAKKYTREFGSDGDYIFSPADRREAAVRMARRFEDEMEAQGREGVEHLAGARSASEGGGTSPLRCDMTKDCQRSVTHVDSDGYVYCTPHGQQRKDGGHRCRKLRPGEITKLERGEAIRY